MKILILGAGRMGLRHAIGISSIEHVSEVCLTDIADEALINAKEQVSDNPHKTKFSFKKIDELSKNDNQYSVAIIASTASDRIGTCQIAINAGAQTLLIEKPLGQSISEVYDLCNFIDHQKVNAYVNLGMRLYDGFAQLKNDLQNKPQLAGNKVITINSGALGIGAMGIHYLDLIHYLLDAERAVLVESEIEPTMITSGRGQQFGDFGGWCVIKYLDKNENYKGRALLSLSSGSTVFGNIEIVAPHGRISIDELQEKRTDQLRKEDSTMPIHRYAADYLPPVETKFESPFLGDLSRKWLQSLIEGKQLLPAIKDSLNVHKLLFDWLSSSKTHKEVFPIT